MKSSTDIFEHAFNFSPIGMAMVSLHGHWLKVNPALCDILGYSEEELLELDFGDITYPDDLENDWSIVRKLINGEEARTTFEKRYIRKNGETFWASLSVAIARDSNSVFQYFVCHIQDISEHKRAQMALVYNSKMVALGANGRHTCS